MCSFFGVERGTALWQHPVPVVWPVRIEFDEAHEIVLVCGENDGRFRYTFARRFLDEELLRERAREAAGDDESGYRLFDLARVKIAQTLMQKRSSEETQEIETLIRLALAKRRSSNTQAAAHRILGEIAEQHGEAQTALVEYRGALPPNHKIGLKTRVAALEAAGTGSKS